MSGSLPEAHCKLIREENLSTAGLLESPLTDSNRRPPPYHAIQTATGGSRWQGFVASSSRFRTSGHPNLCHPLRPLCSITVPSQSAQNGQFEAGAVTECAGDQFRSDGQPTTFSL